MLQDVFANVKDTDSVDTPINDFMWLYSKFNSEKTSGWNSFQENAHVGQEFETSLVLFLPFVNNPPTSFDTILTVMAESARDNHLHFHQKFIFLSFDQQLWIKAWEILASIDPNNDPLHLLCIKLRRLSHINEFFRLHRFHYGWQWFERSTM